ncbi:unnamed protein product [Sphagnum balticum]
MEPTEKVKGYWITKIKMQLECIIGICKEITPNENSHCVGRIQVGVVVKHLLGSDFEGECGSGKVCAADGDSGIDEDAVVGCEAGCIPVHCDKQIRIAGKCLGESELK